MKEIYLLSKGTCDYCQGGEGQSSCCENSDLRSCPVWAGHCNSDDQCDGGSQIDTLFGSTLYNQYLDLRCGSNNCKNVYTEALTDSNCCYPHCPAGSGVSL